MIRVCVVVISVIVLSACNDSGWSGPSGPSSDPRLTPPSAPPPRAQPAELSGTVYEHGAFGRRVLPNVVLDISGLNDRPDLQWRSDASGQYRVSAISGSEMRVVADAPGYYQQCMASVRLTGDTTLDVHLVRDTTLAASGIPSSMPIAETRVFGRVFGRTPRGPRHMRATEVIAIVGVELGDYVVRVASTVTDSAGRFVMCGARPGVIFEVDGAKEGFESDTRNYEDGTTSYDFELNPY